MRKADIRQIEYGGRSVTEVNISEVGKHLLSASVLSTAVRARALDVVTISFDRAEGSYVLEANGIVTTELLTDDIRLQISPKVSFDALDVLLAWSNHPHTVIEGQKLPVDFGRNVGVYDMFARRLVASVEEVLRMGWIPHMRTREMVSEAMIGRVDPIKSYEHIATRLELGFVQDVSRMSFGSMPNRILKTALLCVAHAERRIAADLIEAARDILCGMDAIEPLADTGVAFTECNRIVSERTLDGTRGYYYPALGACLPILEATSRVQGANAQYEDIPMRISMPATFESAVRNLTAAALRRTHEVVKGAGEPLYGSASRGFGPSLEPDIIIKPLGHANVCTAVLDVKYKERPSPGDHYQIASYMAAYEPPIAGFVTLTDVPEEEGVRSQAVTRGGKRVIEYALLASNLEASMRRYADWVASGFS